MAHFISSLCINCGICKFECPTKCISNNDNTYVIDKKICLDCGICENVCPQNAVKPEIKNNIK